MKGEKQQAANIEALKDALRERDKLISNCIGDIVELKKEVERYRRLAHDLIMRYQEIKDVEEGKVNGN